MRTIINEFRELLPFGRYHHGFRVMLPPSDPRVNEVLRVLERRHIPRQRPCKKEERPPVEYYLEYHRQYDLQDYDTARYLLLHHQVLVAEEHERDEEENLVLPAGNLTPGAGIGCVQPWPWATVVSDELRHEMVATGLIGLQFEPVVVQGRVCGTIWELRSPIILPPMPAERVVRIEDLPADDPHVADYRDGDFCGLDKEIHYAESEIGKIEPFDLGLTHEIFGRSEWRRFAGERLPIVSQRFRQFCLARKLKLSWVPVRIDPDEGTSSAPAAAGGLTPPPLADQARASGRPANVGTTRTATPPPSPAPKRQPSVQPDAQRSAPPPIIRTSAEPPHIPETARVRDPIGPDLFLAAIFGGFAAHFRMMVCDLDASNPKWVEDFAVGCGVRLPNDFCQFVRKFGAIRIEATESVWPRPKPGNVEPAWSFRYGLFVYGCCGAIHEALDLRVQTPKFRQWTGAPVVPFLGVVSDPDLYCFDERGNVHRWDHETGSLIPQGKTFTEVFVSESEALRQRTERLLGERPR